MDIKGAAPPAVSGSGGPGLVDDAARALVGQEVSRRSGTVVRREFQRWAAAVGDRNPLYFDAEHARAHGHPDVVAPPLWLQTVVLGVYHPDELRPDGVPGGFLGAVPLPRTPRLMAGGDAYEFHAYAYHGDEVTAVRRVVSVEEKHGRSGAFVVVASETAYTTGNGTLLATHTENVLALP